MNRTAAALLALAMGANGAVMLAAGRWWYGVAPGVTETGPFNAHFVNDIGAAYLLVGAAFAWLALRSSELARGAALLAAAFLALHGFIHLADAVAGLRGFADLVRDFPGVFLPALVAAWLVWTSTPNLETRHA